MKTAGVRSFSCGLIGVAMLGGQQAAAAPSPNSTAIEEAMVTATKRKEDVQSVPIAETACSATALVDAVSCELDSGKAG